MALGWGTVGSLHRECINVPAGPGHATIRSQAKSEDDILVAAPRTAARQKSRRSRPNCRSRPTAPPEGSEEFRRNRSVVGGVDAAARRHDVGEGSTVNRDFEHSAVVTFFQIVAVPEPQRNPPKVLYRNGRGVQTRISHTAWGIMECGIGRRVGIGGSGRPVRAQRAGARAVHS